MQKRGASIFFSLCAVASLIACGSASTTKQEVDLYKNQTVELMRDTWENGLSMSGVCDDGNTTCRSYHYAEMNNDGNVMHIDGCRPPSGPTGISGDYFCHIYDQTSAQVPQAQLQTLKKIVVNAQPADLADTYDCSSNDSCTSDPTELSLTLVVDGVSKSISYSDGGPSASAAFSAILEAVSGIGL